MKVEITCYEIVYDILEICHASENKRIIEKIAKFAHMGQASLKYTKFLRTTTLIRKQ